jgi:hypothetical protein
MRLSNKVMGRAVIIGLGLLLLVYLVPAILSIVHERMG